eukprot:3964060-Amphidinium_carterae.1
MGLTINRLARNEHLRPAPYGPGRQDDLLSVQDRFQWCAGNGCAIWARIWQGANVDVLVGDHRLCPVLLAVLCAGYSMRQWSTCKTWPRNEINLAKGRLVEAWHRLRWLVLSSDSHVTNSKGRDCIYKQHCTNGFLWKLSPAMSQKVRDHSIATFYEEEVQLCIELMPLMVCEHMPLGADVLCSDNGTGTAIPRARASLRASPRLARSPRACFWAWMCLPRCQSPKLAGQPDIGCATTGIETNTE